MAEPRFWAVVPAAGVGRRLQAASPSATPKQYLELQGQSILAHTLQRLDAIAGLAGIVLVLGEQDDWFGRLSLTLDSPLLTAPGGAERARSVRNGLAALAGRAADNDWVLVHDAVRPCVSSADIERLRGELAQDPVGGLLAIPVRETLKRATPQARVASTVPREEYWLAATPQMFRYGLLTAALDQALQEGAVITDEAHAMERAGHPVRLVAGRADNIKITHIEDLALAEHILNSRAAAPGQRQGQHGEMDQE